MKVNPKAITGNWDKGFALDKHTLSSVYLGDDDNGHPQFDTTRTEIGEALFQLKYREGWGNIASLGSAMANGAKAAFAKIDLIVPMPASTVRARQPVTELAIEVARQLGRPVDLGLLQKGSTPQLKNLNTREEKDAVLAGVFSIHDAGMSAGPSDILLVDDLIHTGASLHAACAALRKSGKVGRIYVAAISWR
ncbi:ComF family protein [Sphingomonas sp. Leaf343]|uniref:ComF family protein n=1 Tax=Sphingomonas sp. Leaf343 TaxID=1736345 RepID=UPI0006FE6379|nr:ComF family protein [Sphingomonas sp. Leaf343]KQR82247.1 hypothetical protein ASG07_11280 [Sphingomonas sp. Leaf343]